MRVVLNHLTKGLIYKDFWQLGPALAGTLISCLYQLINLYGFLPALLIIGAVTALLGTVMVLSLFCLSLFFIPLPVCVYISLIIMAVSLLSWLLINVRINCKAKLKIFKLNYSSRLAFMLLSFLLCNQVVPVNISARTKYWDVHFKPYLAGKINHYDFATLNKLMAEDLLKIKEILGDNTLLFGCTPGSLATHFANWPEEYEYRIIKTVIPSEHAEVFGLTRDFHFHVVVL